MLGSPFNKNSPILTIYERSRSKSKDNREPVRNRSKSFKQFQTKMIIKALDKNHVIQKQYHQGWQKDLEKQRVRSKLYGPESYRMNSHLPKKYQMQGQNYISRLEAEPKKEQLEKLHTMLKIKVTTSNQKLMSYESNYAIHNKEGNFKIDCCSEHINSIKSVSNKSSEKNQRKISIVNSLEEQFEPNQKCKSRFVKNKIDRIKQEYSGSGQKLTQSRKMHPTNSNHQLYQFELI